MFSMSHFSEGVDYSRDAAIARWFKRRFPNLELLRFIVCGSWPYATAHHIVEIEGEAHHIVECGIVPVRLVPKFFRRATTRDFKLQRLPGGRLRLSMVMWIDTPLSESHPFGPLCPSRWDGSDWESKVGQGSPKLRLVIYERDRSA